MLIYIFQTQSADTPLNSITKETMMAGKDLQDITEEKVNSLETFNNSTDLVNWLRKEITGL